MTQGRLSVVFKKKNKLTSEIVRYIEGSSSSNLLEADVIVITNEICSQMYGKPVGEGFLCAAATGRDSCLWWAVISQRHPSRRCQLGIWLC